jgi:hypothetical protein
VRTRAGRNVDLGGGVDPDSTAPAERLCKVRRQDLKFSTCLLTVTGKHGMILAVQLCASENHADLRETMHGLLVIRRCFFGVAGMPISLATDNPQRDHGAAVAMMEKHFPEAFFGLVDEEQKNVVFSVVADILHRKLLFNRTVFPAKSSEHPDRDNAIADVTELLTRCAIDCRQQNLVPYAGRYNVNQRNRIRTCFHLLLRGSAIPIQAKRELREMFRALRISTAAWLASTNGPWPPTGVLRRAAFKLGFTDSEVNTVAPRKGYASPAEFVTEMTNCREWYATSWKPYSASLTDVFARMGQNFLQRQPRPQGPRDDDVLARATQVRAEGSKPGISKLRQTTWDFCLKQVTKTRLARCMFNNRESTGSSGTTSNEAAHNGFGTSQIGAQTTSIDVFFMKLHDNILLRNHAHLLKLYTNQEFGATPVNLLNQDRRLTQLLGIMVQQGALMANAHMDASQISCSYFYDKLHLQCPKFTTEKELLERGFKFLWKGPWSSEENAAFVDAAKSYAANPLVISPYVSPESWIAHSVVPTRSEKEVFVRICCVVLVVVVSWWWW